MIQWDSDTTHYCDNTGVVPTLQTISINPNFYNESYMAPIRVLQTPPLLMSQQCPLQTMGIPPVPLTTIFTHSTCIRL